MFLDPTKLWRHISVLDNETFCDHLQFIYTQPRSVTLLTYKIFWFWYQVIYIWFMLKFRFFSLCLVHCQHKVVLLDADWNSTISCLLQVNIVFPLCILFLFDICWSINWTFSALTSIYWTGKEIVVQLQQQTIPHSSVSLFYLEQIQGCNHHCKFSQFIFEAKLH